MPRLYVTSRGRAGVSFGCLGIVLYGFAMLFWWMLVAVIILGVLALWVLAYLAVWAAVGIDAVLMKASAGYRAKRSERGPLPWPKQLVEALDRSAKRAKPGRRT